MNYLPNGSNYHDHLCSCPGCNYDGPEPTDAEVLGIAISDADIAYVWDEVPGVSWYAYQPEIIQVPMEDEAIHTVSRPFCTDESCPCHMDGTLFGEYIYQPMMDGLMTSFEANRFHFSETL